MIRQPGCLSEKMLRCETAPGEYISYSEWEDDESIQKYLASEDHQEIKRHNPRALFETRHSGSRAPGRKMFTSH